MKNNKLNNLDTPILITGAKGFIGRNLTARLTATGFTNLMLYDIHSTSTDLAEYAKTASFIFHLAGVNRPKDPSEFYTGNADLTQQLLNHLREFGNSTPLLLSSTAQAGNETDYAKSKEQAENAVFEYGSSTGSPVFVYRLPGVFGKWSRPSYNSVVATFCHNIARGDEISVHDPNFELPLCYIDDVVDSFISVMNGQIPPLNSGQFLSISPIYRITLGNLANTIQGFQANRTNLELPNMANPLTEKLYATYLSYLPEDSFSYPLTMHADNRGSFTEFLRTQEHGQVSINITKPGITKGNHWHNTKNEKFLVVSGEGLITFRMADGTTKFEYKVSGDTLEVVDIPTGYTHNIQNTGQTDLVTVMWASEPFNPEKPDTFFAEV